MKSLKTKIGLIFTILTITAVSMQGQSKQSQSKTLLKKGYKYKSTGFSCIIKPNGSIRGLSYAGTPLIIQELLYGRYEILEGKKHDRRFFPRDEKKFPPEISEGEKKCIIKKSGTLSNKKYKKACEYTKIIMLSPEKVEINVKVKLLVPLASHSSIFCSLNYLPISIFACKGLKVTDLKGKEKLMVFPEKFKKGESLRGLYKSMSVSLDKGILSLNPGENTCFSMSDTRSWNKNGKFFRVDVKQYIPWKSKPSVYPAGTLFKWSFSWNFKKHES